MFTSFQQRTAGLMFKRIMKKNLFRLQYILCFFLFDLLFSFLLLAVRILRFYMFREKIHTSLL